MMKDSSVEQPKKKKNQIPLDENMSNLTSASGEASVSISTENGGIYPPQYAINHHLPPPPKKKRSQPDPGAEVISLSPRSLMATNRFVCEICNKGFQRDQNLQLHRRGHNLPWKLKQRVNKEVRKKVYVCPEASCVHHDPSRALGDLTGIKKHFCRKHGEKKWKCDKCSKKYAVQSDWKAHSKTCGTREYRCDCGTLFSRRDSFITHRAFCDALAEENAKSITRNPTQTCGVSHHLNLQQIHSHLGNQTGVSFPIKKEDQQQSFNLGQEIPPWLSCPSQGQLPHSQSSIFHHFQNSNPNPSQNSILGVGAMPMSSSSSLLHYHPAALSPHVSATALLQKAAEMGAKSSNSTSQAGEFIRAHQAHVFAGESGLPSRDGVISYWNKAASGTHAGEAIDTSNAIVGSSSFMHEMMGSSFEEMGFAELLAHQMPLKKDEGDDKGLSFHGNNHNNNHHDGLTRDFLGLRPLSQSEMFLSFADCMDGNEMHHKSWQG